ncbi:aldolase [Tilletiaria anomala UBC 951]|uniref:Aldolase n=1 Tax=Tilletiaria anomala (strain ATCC 24038 / CBS 436.72 / UBC 951) TaxID=1037660 RepID=A0A066VLT7_TILAU|nr:aldolase [Tilletiaria anomala UBC 951]KDN41243.1 aldolase [Tilletiaria anomala UBC 951]
MAPTASPLNGNGSASSTHHTNGSSTSQPNVPGGIYVPIVTPFLSKEQGEELDLPTLQKHCGRLASAGCGIVLMGTNGEASHMTREERQQVISTVRKLLPTTPIIAGTGTGSLKETITLTKDAAQAGADAVLVIAPGYFSAAIGKNQHALKEYFTEVASASPVPVMLYNFPAAAAGIDMDSDLLCSIAEHPNVIGGKLTCSQIGKGARLVSALQAQAAAHAKPVWHVWPGFADVLLPAMTIGMTGVIAGTGNLFPHTLVELYMLIDAAFREKDFGKLEQAQKLQELVGRADWCMAKAGIAGSKWALGHWFYDMGVPRRPLQPLGKEGQQMMLQELQEAMEHERRLAETKGDKFVAKA